ncbi:MAG: hypothetical protein JXR69_09395 [Candidatus Delongbacteria bacterium]|nr:hypothetical protein [Candidatus Delongbacteria bacterium]
MKKVISMLILILGMSLLAQTSTPPSAGDGSSGNPYQIGTLENLYWIASNSGEWNKYYIQTADIDASSTSTWNSGTGWTPIGNMTTKFTGNYNGNKHTISGLYINRPSNEDLGFFGVVQGGTINYLGIKNITISGYRYIGALAGRIVSSSPVNYCFTTGVVTASYDYSYTGGLFGYSYETDTFNCYTRTNVNGRQNLGGFIGLSSFSDITNCYSTGLVTSYHPNYEGGFIGGWTGNDLYPGLTANFWDIQSSGTSIGIIGRDFPGVTGKTTLEMQTDTTFTNAGWNFSTVWGIDGSYNGGYPFLLWERMSLPILTTQDVSDISTTTATGNGTIVDPGFPYPTQHGFCWNTSGLPSLSDSKTEEGIIDSTGTFSSQLLMLDNYTTYYVRAYATNDLGTSYSDEVIFTTLAILPATPSGSGTDIDPYLISNMEELYWIAEDYHNWDKFYLQTADIDASITASINNGEGWLSIGDQYESFTGSYDGQNYSISNLFIDHLYGYYTGLFGQAQYASISNVNLIDAEITSGDYTGTLIGYSNSSVVDNCSASGYVNGQGMIGGLIGATSGNSSPLITNCSYTGTVSGESNIGGLIGQIQNYAIIQNCFTDAVVTATSNYCGGLIGEVYSYSTVENCYSSGSVHGMYTFGGFIGMLNNECTVLNCYSESDVYGDQIDYYYYYEYSEQVGGFIGHNYVSDIYNSYSTGSVYGLYDVGGFIGTNNGTTDVINCFSSGSVTSDDNPGGFIGYLNNGSSAVITNCFWDIETSGQTTSQGGSGVVGKTTAEMTTQATFTDATWDFVIETTNGTDDYWNINAGVNSGYPFLSWQDVVLPLGIPQNLVITRSTDPELTWDAVSGATSYTVYYSEDPYATFPTSWTEVTGITGTSWTDTDATESKKFYIVVAVN